MNDLGFEQAKKDLWELYRFNFRLTLIHKIKGIDFSRCFEYAATLRKLNIKGGEEILDIGSSNSSFPLFLSSKGARVTMLDIAGEKMQYTNKYTKKLKLDFQHNKGSIYTSVQDAKKMDFPDNKFDFVSCISVVEHIQDNGDGAVMLEIARVLKPGGRTIVSVPYAQKFSEGKFSYYFQRWYDYQGIDARLIQPSKLKIEERRFFIDSRTRKVSDILYYKIPHRYLKHLLGWAQFPLALKFMKKDKATKDNAWVAWMCLQKKEK